MTVIEASRLAGFSERTGHKWLKRFRLEGNAGLQDRFSQPHHLARSHELGLVVEAVGRRRRGQAAVRIASELGMPRSTVGFWLRKAGISRASALQEKEPPNRYEHEAPGDLLHLDTKKLANFHEVGHHATGIRHHKNRKAGYQVLHTRERLAIEVGTSLPGLRPVVRPAGDPAPLHPAGEADAERHLRELQRALPG